MVNVYIFGYLMEKMFEFINLYFYLYVDDLLLYFNNIMDYFYKMFFFGLIDYIFFVLWLFMVYVKNYEC